MATIRKHRNKFQAIVRRKGFPPQSKSFTRRADAVAWASITESEMERSEFVDRSEADRMTFKDALEKYQDSVTPRKKGAKQERVRISYWKNHRLARCALSKIRPKDFADWRDIEIRAGKAASTVNNHLILISHLFNHARKEWGIPVRNPIEDIWRPKLPKGRDRRLKDGEESLLLSEASKVHALLPSLILFAIETGMRRVEIATMKRDLVVGNTVSLLDTKNGDKREVPLSKTAKAILASLPKCIDGRVWPFYPDMISHMFAKTVREADIKDLRFHDLRHEATSRLARIYPIHELARITGHKTLTMLLRYYHPTGDELAERLARSELSAPAPQASG